MKWIAQIKLNVATTGGKDVLVERGSELPAKTDPALLAALRLQGLVVPRAEPAEPAKAAEPEFVPSADELPAKSAKKDHWEATALLLGVPEEELAGLDKAGVVKAATKAFEARTPPPPPGS